MKSKKRGTYEHMGPYVPKGLAKRLMAWKANQTDGRTYDPPNGTRLHRPGSQRK